MYHVVKSASIGYRDVTNDPAYKLNIYQGMSIIGLHSPITLETSKESCKILGWVKLDP